MIRSDRVFDKKCPVCKGRIRINLMIDEDGGNDLVQLEALDGV